MTCKCKAADPGTLQWHEWLKWHLQSVSQMVHNLHSEKVIFSVETMTKWVDFSKDLHLRSYLTFGMAWRSSLLCQDEWQPACREHGVILMLPGAQRLECMEVHYTWADMADEVLTCLIFWASHSCSGKQWSSDQQLKLLFLFYFVTSGDQHYCALVFFMSLMFNIHVQTVSLTWRSDTPGGRAPCL